MSGPTIALSDGPVRAVAGSKTSKPHEPFGSVMKLVSRTSGPTGTWNLTRTVLLCALAQRACNGLNRLPCFSA